MLCAAVFGAEQMKVPLLAGRKPFSVVSAGHDVLLCAERGNEKAVDHVLAGHHQLDGPADRNMKLVDLSCAFRMLHLPHPLPADDVDDHRVSRRALKVYI